MQINKREFPNPVLAPGRDDYTDGNVYTFTVDTDNISVDKEFINIPVSYELVCKSLEDKVREGVLAPIVKVRSSAASYCRVRNFEHCKKNLVLQIGKYDVVSSIEVTGLIVANEEMLHFSCDEMNQMYFSGTTFDFRKGDIIATDAPRVIYIDDSELEKPIASIFTINNGHDQEEQIEVEFSDNKIVINLNEELNKMYWTLKDFNNGALQRYVTAVIVYPALVEAIDMIRLHYLNANDEDYSEKRWFRAIELKASKYNISMEQYAGSATMLANKLLGGISLDALKSFKDVLDQEMNSGETQVIGGVD